MTDEAPSRSEHRPGPRGRVRRRGAPGTRRPAAGAATGCAPAGQRCATATFAGKTLIVRIGKAARGATQADEDRQRCERRAAARGTAPADRAASAP
jgi:hypothetical protein